VLAKLVELGKSDYSVVSENEKDTLVLRDADLSAILWKAIQELSDKNDALEARIATLEGG